MELKFIKFWEKDKKWDPKMCPQVETNEHHFKMPNLSSGVHTLWLGKGLERGKEWKKIKT